MMRAGYLSFFLVTVSCAIRVTYPYGLVASKIFKRPDIRKNTEASSLIKSIIIFREYEIIRCVPRTRKATWQNVDVLQKNVSESILLKLCKTIYNIQVVRVQRMRHAQTCIHPLRERVKKFCIRTDFFLNFMTGTRKLYHIIV